jgi:hypothetical protein
LLILLRLLVDEQAATAKRPKQAESAIHQNF